MRKVILVIALLHFFISFLFSQVVQEWVRFYNGPGDIDDNAQSVTVDLSGNVYVTGSSYGNGTDKDFATIKYNSTGVQQWAQRYNGPANDYDGAVDIAVDALGNVYVTGSSVGTLSDYMTIKYNSFGVQQWTQRYDGPGNGSDAARSILIDLSGNVYVTGNSVGVNGYNYATIKYSPSGVVQWVRRYDGPGTFDLARSIAIDASGNIYVTGMSDGNGISDYATVKYNSSGDELWVRRYDAGGTDEATSIALDPNSNVYVTGHSFANGTSSDYATVKYNSLGDEQWVQRYNGPGNSYDVAFSIITDLVGNVCITGSSVAFVGGGSDYATIKYNASGSVQWIRRYDGQVGSDEAYSIAVDGINNVYVTGVSAGGLSTDYATIKYTPQGTEQWVQRYSSPGTGGGDAAYSIVTDVSNNVYVTGYGFNVASFDYATLKYSQSIGIEPISTEIPSNFSLHQNYPNPFNPMTNVRFQIPKRGFLKLNIFNTLGKEVTMLVNEELNPGTYEVGWDASNYPSGVYYYKLIAGDYSETKKMILIK